MTDSARKRFDVERILEKNPIADFVGRYVRLRSVGSELQGLCPFHGEQTPSFTVSVDKQFAHCFGCGWHGDVIAFAMQHLGISFADACRQLAGDAFPVAALRQPAPPEALSTVPARHWLPLTPVPEDAAALLDEHGWVAVMNPKRGRVWRMRPDRFDAYRGGDGRLIGYVLRINFDDGQKITPQVTWCVAPDGATAWALRPFPRPRPLQGLDALALRPSAPVLIVEGEKCRECATAAFPQYVVMTWPGGSKGIRHVDWTSLASRDVVLWPDADTAGTEAMLGYVHYNGLLVDGVAQCVARIGASSIRYIDPAGQPQGWDVADALDVEGWPARQAAAWAAARVVDIEVTFDPNARAA